MSCCPTAGPLLVIRGRSLGVTVPSSAAGVHVMDTIILCLFRFVRLLGSGHQAVAVENLALRLQLAAFKKKRKRPVLTQWDRLCWDDTS